MSTEIDKMPTDIDKMTDEELDEFIEKADLKCKIDTKSGSIKCATDEEINRAIARLKNPIKSLVFEIITKVVESADPADQPGA